MPKSRKHRHHTPEEQAHLDRVAALGCRICGRPPELHHIRTGYGKGQRASHFEVLPLCARHHRTGGVGVAFHAAPNVWQAKYGTELEHLEEVRRLLAIQSANSNIFFRTE